MTEVAKQPGLANGRGSGRGPCPLPIIFDQNCAKWERSEALQTVRMSGVRWLFGCVSELVWSAYAISFWKLSVIHARDWL